MGTDNESSTPPDGRKAIFPWDTEDRPSLPPKALRVMWLAALGCVILALATPIIPRLVHRDAAPQPLPPRSQLVEVTFPTEQEALLDRIDATVFQPTSSGRPQSALYGSVRTYKSGAPKFHEGIDIAPVRRNRKRQALDPIYAVGDGKIVYINRSAGSSSYGKYLVLEHLDPVGPVYTLYAHLASVAEELEEEVYVAKGRELGIMGHTSTLGVPVSRSHLHFEIGLLMNRDFPRFTPTPHGIFDGRNLTGLDPIAFFRFKSETSGASFEDFLLQIPQAFTVVVKSSALPDFFKRYAPLWIGEPYAGGPITILVSEGGVPLQGRNATADEIDSLAKSTVAVVSADAKVLGRNARRLVVKDKQNWQPGKSLEYWIRALMFSES